MIDEYEHHKEEVEYRKAVLSNFERLEERMDRADSAIIFILFMLPLLMVVFFLVSCSSLEPAQVTPTPAPRIIPHGRAIMVYSEGDSTMYGCHVGEYNGDVKDQTPNNPPAILQSLLNTQVLNEAKDGSMLSDSLNGTGGYQGTLEDRLLASTAQIVITNSAHNEAGNGTTILNYWLDLNQWVTTVSNAGKIPVIEEPNPSTCWFDRMPAYIAIQREIARDRNVLIIEQWDAILVLDWKNMLQDCVHPTDELYEFKAKREADVLRPIVEQLQQ